MVIRNPKLKKYHQAYVWLQHHGWLIIGSGLLLLFIIQIHQHGQAITQWDWLLLSGSLAFLIGIQKARQVPQKLRQTLQRLSNRGTLIATLDQLNEVEERINEISEAWSRKASIVTASAILLAFISIYGLGNIILAILETIGGYIAGWCLGRMSAYGTLALVLKQKKLKLRAEPAHIDNVCGFKPVGDFYLFQALVAAIPAIFLAVWWIIIPIFPRDYSHWREIYLSLLVLAVTFEILIFAFPMNLFHQEMEEQKSELLKEADQLSQKIVALQRQLIDTDSADEREELKNYLDDLLNHYQMVEQMTTWPIHPRSFRRFTIRNLLLLIPILTEFTGNQRFWQVLQQLLVGLNLS